MQTVFERKEIKQYEAVVFKCKRWKHEAFGPAHADSERKHGAGGESVHCGQRGNGERADIVRREKSDPESSGETGSGEEGAGKTVYGRYRHYDGERVQ